MFIPRPAKRHSPSSVSWAVPWASSRWDVPGTPPEVSRGHPEQMSKPTQLTPLDVEKHRLYSKLLSDGRAPHPISNGVPGDPVKETHFIHLNLSVMTQSSCP
ncbi:hypothetical protein AMECASPLE_035886 [Ameca splendens]|uniref:Uncharacterized protein n=1 Tax=Ameca splendens TaxID=208324 RepID=A0ABV0Y7C4_9TELE